jgi:hypothetical protein
MMGGIAFCENEKEGERNVNKSKYRTFRFIWISYYFKPCNSFVIALINPALSLVTSSNPALLSYGFRHKNIKIRSRKKKISVDRSK